MFWSLSGLHSSRSPPGDWNDGLVAKDPETGHPCFERAIRTIFPGVKSMWHKTYVDYQDIVVGEKLRTGIYEITCSRFDVPVVAKFARFEWEIQYLENETAAYEWIDGRGIAPQFLGHLTEDGRVIGYLMERITNARHSRPGDLIACQETLSKLHQLGICHGDINRFNFLVRGSEAVLVDFDTARKCNDQDAFQEELNSLPGSLNDTSMRGGGGLLCVAPNYIGHFLSYSCLDLFLVLVFCIISGNFLALLIPRNPLFIH